MPMLDGLKRSLGMRVESDVEAARGEIGRIRKDGEEGRFAAVVGREMARLSNADLRRALPSLASDMDGPIPSHRQKEMRELHVAKGLKSFADRYVEQGASSTVGPELGRVVRREGLSRLARESVSFRAEDVFATTLPDLVDRQSQTVEANTRAYLGAGSRNELAMDRAANIMDAFDRGPKVPGAANTREALALQVAMARAGMLSPANIVQAANRSDIVGSMKEAGVHDRHQGEPDMVRIVPDFERGRRAASNDVLRKEAIEHFRTSMTRIHPRSHSQRVFLEQVVLGGKDLTTGTRRDVAAAAASMSQGVAR